MKKNILLSLPFLAYALLILLNTPAVLQAGKNTLRLWACNVVPTLFPFVFCATALMQTPLPYYAAKCTGFVTAFLGYGRDSAFLLFTSLLCGYPTGAKTAGACFDDCNADCLCLIRLCHNASPAFVLGSVPTLLGLPECGMMLLFCHYGGVLACAALLAPKTPPTVRYRTAATPAIGEILLSSCGGAINAVLTVGGMMLFFAPVASLARMGALGGLIEMTSGMAKLQGEPALPCAAFMLSFSGLCVLAQCAAFLPHNTPVLPVLATRLLAGAISFVLALLWQYSVALSILCAAVLLTAPYIIRTVIKKRYGYLEN